MQSRNKVVENKKIRLGDNEYLHSLTEQGLIFHGRSADSMIKVAAVEDHTGGWAAYFATPDTPFGDVVNYGNKLPRKTAEEIFPDWAKKGLKWRI